jgi:uncharacterized repeat protein (TIGR03803 family)
MHIMPSCPSWARFCALSAVALITGFVHATPVASGSVGESPDATGFTLMHAFGGADGAFPEGTLLQATDGNFYGTTEAGGEFKHGTVFKMTPEGRFTTLHSFKTSDGTEPSAGLVEGPDGWLYGTAFGGGALPRCPDCGTIFRIARDGKFQVVHQFAGGADDGQSPGSALILASDGNFYGTTEDGGRYAYGTVYRLTPDGVVAVLRSFGLDGREAHIGGLPGPLIQGSDGLLYGANDGGGRRRGCSVNGGCGVLFRMTLAGELVDIYSMRDSLGVYPVPGLMEAGDGNLYGVAVAGGPVRPRCFDSCGTIYRVTHQGRVMRVHAFVPSEGAGPQAPPLQASDGNLYGTAYYGGVGHSCEGCGTVYRLTPDGDFTVIHAFNGFDDGEAPAAGLIEGRDGALYGTTSSGGPLAHGTIFRLAMPLPQERLRGVK